jgi:hypothetical protein
MKVMPANSVRQVVGSLRGGALDDQRGDGREGRQIQGRRHAIDPPCPQPVADAAQRRTRDLCDLSAGRGQRGRARQPFARHHRRDQRGQGRCLKGAGRTHDDDGGVDQRLAAHAMQGRDRQHQRGQRFQRHAHRHDLAAVVAVGHMAHHQGQRRHGQELRQADQAQVQGAAA